MRRIGWAPLVALWLGSAASAQQASAPPPPAPLRLSLQEVLRLAQLRSEQVLIARAGVDRADAAKMNAFSGYLPQLGGTVSYNRILKSQFDVLRNAQNAGGGGGGGGTAGGGGGAVSQDITQFFASPSTWRIGVSFSQNLFTGGRVIAANQLAAASQRTAALTLAEARASAALDAAQAYYDAVLSERLVAIAEATLKQTRDTLAQVQLARKVGARPEFDLLRAQVAVENQKLTVLQQQMQRDLTALRLKQLIEIPLDTPIVLASSLEAETLPDPGPLAIRSAGVDVEAEAARAARVPVRQSLELIHIRESQVRIARSQHFPQVALTSSYGLVDFSNNPFNDLGHRWFTNWDVGVSLSVPLFTGFRIHSDVLSAQADLAESQASLRLTRELTELDTRSVEAQLRTAQAAWEASASALELARRALEIADLRFREGISTQVELSDARLQFEIAGANRARAARDFQVARIRLALLPYLPITQVPSAEAATGVAPATTAGAATQLRGAATNAAAAGAPATPTTGTTPTGAGTGTGGFTGAGTSGTQGGP